MNKILNSSFTLLLVELALVISFDQVHLQQSNKNIEKIDWYGQTGRHIKANCC